jgi:hypothetical protein
METELLVRGEASQHETGTQPKREQENHRQEQEVQLRLARPSFETLLKTKRSWLLTSPQRWRDALVDSPWLHP